MKRVWTTTPPAGTPIDWDNDLTEGLVAVAVPWEVLPIDPVTGARYTYNPGSYNNPPPIIRPGAYGGLGWYLGSQQQYAIIDLPHVAKNVNAYFELITVVDNLLGSNQAFAGEGIQDASVGTAATSGVAYPHGYINGVAVTGTTAITDRARHTIGVAAIPSVGTSVWLDGVVCGTTTSTPFHNGGAQSLATSGGTGGQTIYQDMLYSGLVLTESKRLRLTENPWQIFHKRRRFYSIASGGTLTNLTGTSAVTFGQGGALTGAGALAGTSALNFSAASTLAGLGALLGSSAITFTASGSMGAPGLMIGSASVSFGASGELRATGTLTGSCAVTSTASATLRGAAALRAASAITSGTSATLSGHGALQAASAITADASGTLAGHGALTGSSGATFSGTATLAAAGTLHGTTAIVFSATLTPPVGFLTGVARYTIGRQLARNFTVWRTTQRTFTVRRSQIRVFEVNSMSLRFPVKGPLETVPLTFDFSADLPSGVTLSGTPALTVTCTEGADSNPSAILSGAAAFNSTSTGVVQAAANGEDGCEYTLVCTCPTTQSNLTLTLVGILPVRANLN